jgi:hypothetical protein
VYLLACLIDHGYEITFADHPRFLGADPMGNEAGVFHGLHLVRAVVTDQIVRGKVASEVEGKRGRTVLVPQT